MSKRQKVFDRASARNFDTNGWYEIEANPLSKAGVFPYRGSDLGLVGEDADRIVNVLRSPNELSRQETLESFRLVPIIDEHEILGPREEGRTPPEEKGIEGITGEIIFFDEADATIKGTIKIMSESLKRAIEQGKRELSCGYTCEYVKESGIYNGKSFDFKQTNILGNHIAVVDFGRMGSEVRVLDQDLESHTMANKNAKDQTGLENTEKVGSDENKSEKEDKDYAKDGTFQKAVRDACSDYMKDKEKEAEDKEDKDKEAKDAESKKESEDDGLGGGGKEAETSFDAKDMAPFFDELKGLRMEVADMRANGAKAFEKSITAKTDLADRLAKRIGVFDHSAMDINEVGVYGAQKLKLSDVPTGHEITACNIYLASQSSSPTIPVTALDSVAIDGKKALSGAIAALGQKGAP